jgi:predicted flap endonuclease-1-like 5' DNA nuclease
MKLPKFLTGLLIGTAVGLIIWYWQKSTSAEEGALAVLDRLAVAEARVRELEGRLRLVQEQHHISEQPELLSGLSDLWGLNAATKETELVEAEVEGAVFDELIDTEIAGDDLKAISGIGPAYERRLKEAGIHTYADLAQQTPENIRSITGLKAWQAAEPEGWIAEAQSLSEA